MRIRLQIDSDAARASLRRWGGELRARVRVAAEQALRGQVPVIQSEVRVHVAGQMAIKRAGFLKSFCARVIAKDPSRLPAFLITGKVPWVGIHESGGTINGPVLIPLYGRIGNKRFKQMVTELMRGGNAFFIKKNGKAILMAENIAEHGRVLAAAKRRYRKAEGVKRIKRGEAVPIAVLQPRVTLRKRLDLARLALQSVPRLTRALEQQLKTL
jgi:hypothetical protein